MAILTNCLTSRCTAANCGAMQKILFLAAGIAATLSLAACNGNNEPEVVDTNPDPQAEALKNAPPVELPPAIAASRTYRCKDNSLVYVDFYTNNTARYRTERGGEATTLTSSGEGQPYTAEGHSVSANSANITLTAPGKGTLTCKA